MARIVFDLDGTLIDSVPDIHAAANALLAKEGHDPLPIDTIRGYVGNGAGVLMDRIRAARGIDENDHDRLLADYVARLDTAVDLTRPYPGVSDALSGLARRGHVMGVCTNKPERPARSVLAAVGLSDHFGTIVGGDTLPRRKPDPTPLRATFEAMGEGPMIFVGDSEVDAETAERAGVPFLLFTEGYRKSPVEDLAPSATFDHFNRLLGLVDDILA